MLGFVEGAQSSGRPHTDRRLQDAILQHTLRRNVQMTPNGLS